MHPDINDPKAIELVFLPPNRTSHTQPMDPRCNLVTEIEIQSFISQAYFTVLENNKEIPPFSVLDDMKMLVLAWEGVTKKTVINCFSKAGRSQDQEGAAVNDNGDPFKALTEGIKRLRAQKPDLAP